MVYYTITAVEILGQVKKNALAGTPTTAVFLSGLFRFKTSDRPYRV